MDSSILKEYAEDNFELDDEKLFKSIENTSGKGEIVCSELFLLPDNNILDWLNLKQSVDNNFKCI